jgi:hypothetical protein
MYSSETPLVNANVILAQVPEDYIGLSAFQVRTRNS